MSDGSRVRGLYVITSEVPARGRTHVEVARAALEGGAAVIQLRDKYSPKVHLLETAITLREMCRAAPSPSRRRSKAMATERLWGPGAGALFFVNDRVDVALAAEADGVHLGEEDLSVDIAREIAGDRLLIGTSASTVQEALAAGKAGADYLGVGCIFPTLSKPDAGTPLGVGIIREIKAATDLPVIAIGGINASNAKEALEAGADGLAVISAISEAEDMVAATRNLVTLIEKFGSKNSI